MDEQIPKNSNLSNEILSYYERGEEDQRLLTGFNQLEMVRTEELLERFLPPPPAAVLDVGGGSGHYACWLAKKGYEVHLIDPIPLHVEQAKQTSKQQPDHPLANATTGDARHLEHPDNSTDVVLLFGPLYHLTDRGDRQQVLREAQRVLRSDGIIMAVGISRFASALDGLDSGFIDDPQFVQIIDRDLIDGQHRNPTNNPNYFTTAYFHHPFELQTEVEAVGFHRGKTLAIEGPGWAAKDFEQRWQDDERRALLLDLIRKIEKEPSLLGMSGHIMVTAKKV
ncbi:MAG: class I SAM-dependent methyltransferase [Anaerolineales bacterium]|nr:class I SAM-dependent methyltransferase [Anaerolineales bacterium]